MIKSIPVGVRYMIMSAAGFALMGMFVKITSAKGIPLFEIVAFRALVSALISYVDVRRKKINLLGRKKGLLIARGLVGTFSLICVYYSVISIPFAEATVIQYLNPMFTALLAVVFLHERLHPATMVCVLLSFVGLLVIVRPEFLFAEQSASYSLFPIIVALLGAFGSAIAYVLVRKLSVSEDPSVIIFYFPIIALPVSLILLGDNYVMPQGWTWVQLILVGVMTQVGQLGLTKAMQTETASRATSFSYLQVVFAAVIGWLVFSEIPTLWTILGAALILLGLLTNVVWKSK
jgi:drug/metabolite transporter (DMT)-like permease